MQEEQLIQQKVKGPNGEIRFKYYSKCELLGTGGFAKCYRGIDRDSRREIAIKVVEKTRLLKNRARQKLLSEIKIHKTLKHPHIAEFETVFEDEKNVYIILELCPCRTLSEMLKKRRHLTPMQTRFYMIQLLSALEYLHGNQVIHRDLKMGNIFLNGNMDLKLGDFGLSAKLEFCDEKKRTMAGTPNYIAPEIIEGNGGHSYEVDLWSTGVICYALLYGKPPFETAQIKMTYSRIKNCEYSFPLQSQIPLQAQQFIRNVLVLDPKKRMTIREMLSHPFLLGEIPLSIPKSALTEPPKFLKPHFRSADRSSMSSQKTKLTNRETEPSENFGKKNLRPPLSPTKNPISPAINPIYPTNNPISPAQSPPVSLTRNPPLGLNDFTRPSKENIGDSSFRNFVIAHVDYSTKYGLGYYLNNDSYGVYFNDSTILSLDSSGLNYYYIMNPSQKHETVEKYSRNQLPLQRDYTKKKLLLQKFEVHLFSSVRKTAMKPRKSSSHLYVKQWLKTKHAIMYRLNNHIFQVNFLDQSQILLNTDSKKVLFESKKGQQCFLSLSEALGEQYKNTELGRRIKYTRDILNSLKKTKRDSGNGVEEDSE